MRARHRLGKFLLRREIYWEGRGEAWSRKHRSWLTSGSSPASTPPARSAGSGRSPRPARPTPGGCWSRAPTTTAAARRSAKRQGAASAGNHRRSSTSPGARNAGSTPAGANSKTPAANPTESSPSRSPANSPPTAGRSPPGHPIPTRYRRHPCRRATPSHTQPRSHTSTHQPPAGDSPTHANPIDTPVAAREAARASPARAQQLRDSSPEHPPTRRPRSTIDSGRATNKGLGTAPEYEHDHPSRTRGRPDRPASRNHINHHQPNNGHQPLPLDKRSSIWATQRSRQSSPIVAAARFW